ncbi:MAG: DNA polymerase II small subunit [Candidatus Nanohaloarchaea archaeon]|jgi:DNA polymerase II small subunit
MNKHAVKKLTKEGCIVGKEAAEDITEEDIEAIRDLDTTPMYISETMLSQLRKKRMSGGENPNGPSKKTPNGSSHEANDSSHSAQPNGSSQKVVQKEKASTGENETEQTTSETEKTGVEQPTPAESRGSEKQISTDDANSSKANSQDIEILDNRDRTEMDTKVEIMDEKEISRDEKDVPEFLQYYNDRYDKMKKLLMRRKELQAATTLNRLERRNEGEEATAIGFVKNKYSTNSGKWIVELEDKTGTFKALVDERDGERIVPDEAIGVIGSMGGDIIYANSVVRPDLPIPDGVETTSEDVEAAYISDLHLGSKDTRHDKFMEFAEWLKSKDAKKVGYVVIGGDIVEGVGSYPGQKDELEVTDIYKQYDLFQDWVEKVPEHIQIIAGPGNHDITRLAEPQPRLPEKAFPDIVDYNNLHLIQNPQMVRLHAIRSKGIRNLVYHGYSFDDHVDQIQDLREKAYDEPHHVMIDLLKRRHLAPTYGSNQLSPEGEDHLAITEEPDVFVSGHFHSHSNESYKGVNVINSSSFQEQTDFQKRMGHEPDPGKVTLVDYKTRNTRVKKFF